MESKEITGSWKKHLDYRFLSGEDFGDEVLNLKIKSVTKEEAFNTRSKANEQVVVLHFEGTDKGIILNLTNSRAITRELGTDKVDQWVGKTVSFYGLPDKRFNRVIRVKQNYKGVKV